MNDKITECRQYLQELSEITPDSFTEYLDLKTQAACERYVERIIECVTVIAFVAVKQKKFGLPRDDTDVFSILADKKVISKELSNKLIQAKGMRNIIVHAYSRVNDELVFHAIKNELLVDVEQFLDKLK